MLQYLQRIGKAIMLPIAALPVAGILLGVGGSLINIAALENAPAIYQPLIAFVNIPMITIILKIMQGIGDIVFGNLPVLFAVGTAIGLAKQDKGTAALASVFGFLIMNQVTLLCPLYVCTAGEQFILVVSITESVFLTSGGFYVHYCCSVMSDSLQPYGLKCPRLPCPSSSPRVCSNSCPLSW